MKKICRYFLLVFIVNNYLFSDVFDGYTIFTLNQSGNYASYMIDNNQDILHQWTHDSAPASMPYLMPDSSIIYPYRVNNPVISSGGVGGGIQRISWEGEVLWNHIISDSSYQHHHDICPLPNENILIVCWEKKTAQEAIDLGRIDLTNTNQMWSTAIFELNPNTGDFVWEWHLWDHLIQDINESIPNYGVISNHPELMNINYGTVGSGLNSNNGDWIHVNAIDYNENLDQILISSRFMNEFYIIDHSTTTEEAASHLGGDYNKGGDFLYRWGNPAAYNRGLISDKKLFAQHGVNWIGSNYPGSGGIILFNNGSGRPDGDYSSIEVIMPDINTDGSYFIEESLSFGPEESSWIFYGEQDFYSNRQSGAYRLPNGNTLVTVSASSRIFEVTLEGDIIWDYTHNVPGNSNIPRAMKYSIDYFGIFGDINNDFTINILDIVLLMNIILSDEQNIAGSDLNNDGVVNILDIIQLVNLILSE